MTQIFLVLRHYDYESTTVLSAWTTLEAARVEADRLDEPDYISSIQIQTVPLNGQLCGHGNCGGREVALCCDVCRSF